MILKSVYALIRRNLKFGGRIAILKSRFGQIRGLIA